MSEDARRLRHLLLEVAPRPVPEELTAELRWRDLGVDSLDLLDLVVRCEDEFGVELPDAVVARLHGPAALLAQLSGQLPG